MESMMKVGPKAQVVIPHEFRHAAYLSRVKGTV
jgi:bifunctional DNA-binding transcriptional regulator/antitoxin component of YhaV-PrlF toxin-antitoxin module